MPEIGDARLASDEVPAGACPFVYKDGRQTSLPRLRNLNAGPTSIRASVLERHAHAEAYAALVLAGGYEEAGDRGRFRVEVGDVLFHEEFEGHLDRFPERGAVVLNLRLSGTVGVTAGVARIEDADALARLAERDCREAAELVCLAAMKENPAACR